MNIELSLRQILRHQQPQNYTAKFLNRLADALIRWTVHSSNMDLAKFPTMASEDSIFVLNSWQLLMRI